MAVYLYRLGRFAARRAWAVILVWIIVLASVGAAALTLQKPFTSKLSIPGTEFQRVLDDLDASLPKAAGGSAGVVFSTKDGAPFTQDQKNAVARVSTAWAHLPGVDDATNPFQTQKDLDEARTKLADGKQKLADGEKKLRDNAKKIADGKDKLTDGTKKIDANEKKIADGEAKLENGQAKLDSGRAELEANARKLDEGRAQLEAGQNKIDSGRVQIAAARDKLRDGQAQLDAGRSKLAAGQSQLDDARRKIEAGEKEAALAKAQLDRGQQQLDGAKAKLKQQRAEFDAGRAQVAKGRDAVAQATRQADALAAAKGEDDPEVVALRRTIAEQTAQLDQAQARLDAAEPQLTAGEKALAEQQAKLDAGRAQFEKKTAPLVQARRTIDAKTAELAAGRRALAANQAKLEAGRTTLQQKSAELEAGQRTIDANRAKLADGQAQLDAGRAKLEAGQSTISANRAKLATGKAQLAQGRIDLATAAQQLKDGEAKIVDGRRTIAERKVDLVRGERRLALMNGLRAVSKKGNVAMTTVSFDVPMQQVSKDTKSALPAKAAALDAAGVRVDYSKDIAENIAIGGASEVVGIAAAAVILFVMLGSLLAAGLPLLIAMIGVGTGMLAVLALTHWVEMSDVTPALAVMLGLAVGIDYALFIVHRHRQGLATGDLDVQESIGRATGTAGSAVLFAGLTVIVALTALTLTGIPFLGIMGLAAAGTVLAAVLVALTLTPALLRLMGMRVLSPKARRALAEQAAREEAEAEDEDAQDARPQEGGPAPTAASHPRGRGWGGLVTRHPVIALFASAVVLGLLAIPAASLKLGLPDASQEPHDSTAYRTYATTSQAFGPGQNAAILAVAKVDPAQAKTLTDDQLTDLQLTVAEKLKAHDDVEYVVPAAVSDDHRTLVFQLVPGSGPNDDATSELIHALRSDRQQIVDSTAVDSVGFAGQTVANIDMSELLGAALPKYLAVVVGISIVLLLLVFRSLLVPLLATGGFLLSVAASFGAVVAVYQWGWLGSLFGVEEPGVILSFLPTLAIGILFGLAMDYQMFLVSGMREAWAHGHGARAAVRAGFSHGAKVVTAAALIMTCVFASFIHAPMNMIHSIGFSLAVGVLLDAFVVRMTIMPAVMHLLGERAWYLPRWLQRILPDLDVEGTKLLARREAEETTVPAGSGGPEADPHGPEAPGGQPH